jgi:hypothetical protein
LISDAFIKRVLGHLVWFCQDGRYQRWLRLDSREIPVVGQSSMDNLIGALITYMQQHRKNIIGRGATKALKRVVNKIGRFDGKDITRYLKVYICEMKVHQMLRNTMMDTFGLVMVPEIYERVQEICANEQVTSWTSFEERLKDEYFNEDT